MLSRPAARLPAARLPAAHMPPTEKRHVEDVKDEVLYQRPTTGRNTKLGRRVEKPAEPATGGPSGQHDGAKHNRKHTNK
jgi:hypothetical protein